MQVKDQSKENTGVFIENKRGNEKALPLFILFDYPQKGKSNIDYHLLCTLSANTRVSFISITLPSSKTALPVIKPKTW